MSNPPLATFIEVNRDELIGRCRAKVAERSEPPATPAEIDHGVPLLLTQLATELKRGVPRTNEISDSARSNGHALLVRGLSVDQVVRNYGDVCQAVTEMAVETDTAISAEDFHTLNRCLDDAIAGALTEFAKGQEKTRDGELSELWSLVNSASVAFEALQSGRVGVQGATAGVARQCLAALRAYVDRREMDATRATAAHAASSENKPHA